MDAAAGVCCGHRLESMASYQKYDSSINCCVFALRPILPNFSQSDLKRQSYRLFGRASPQHQEQKEQLNE